MSNPRLGLGHAPSKAHVRDGSLTGPMLQAIAFYVLAAGTIGAALAVVSARNPVHSVLFLFVVMMLDVDFAALRQGFARYLPVGGLVGLVLAVEMVVVALKVATDGAASKVTGGAQASTPNESNVETIGWVLYTDYVYVFQAAGMVLLVAMIGAIVLTLKHRAGVKRQDIAAQVARTPAKGMRVVTIKSGEGIEA